METKSIAVRIRKALVLGLKIGVGSAIAIFFATSIGLKNPTAAGTITLLTLVNTKWGTVELIFRRFFSFFITLFLCLILFYTQDSPYVAFSWFLILIVFVTELLGWGNTLSVNALIGMHFLTLEEITPEFVINEFALLCIGVVIAFVLNLFNDYSRTRKNLKEGMVMVETAMEGILLDVETYIRYPKRAVHPWQSMEILQEKIPYYIRMAEEYQENTFSNAPQCYVEYFKMRMQQLTVLHSLHMELRKIRVMPKQAEIVAQCVEFLAPYIKEHEIPKKQIELLEKMMDELCTETSVMSKEDFQDRAALYHTFMDLREFLLLKEAFLQGLDEDQKNLFFKS